MALKPAKHESTFLRPENQSLLKLTRVTTETGFMKQASEQYVSFVKPDVLRLQT